MTQSTIHPPFSITFILSIYVEAADADQKSLCVLNTYWAAIN